MPSLSHDLRFSSPRRFGVNQHDGVSRIVIGIDPHKALWTAAAVDSGGLRPLATIRVPVGPQGYRGLLRFAARWPGAVWAIEGASGLGAPLATRLGADGIDAVDVPTKLATRVRMLSTGHGRKNDDADAIEHRDDVVKTRTQTVNRLHVLLTQLLPGRAPRQLSADTAAQLLRTVRPRNLGPRTLRRLAADLITEIRHLDRRITSSPPRSPKPFRPAKALSPTCEGSAT
jgi:transposase